MKLNPKPMYRMSLCSNPILNPRWEILEDEKKKEIFDSPEWKLCKAFASQQDQYCDPDNTWYVKARFIDINKTTADCDDYKEHFFPDYIPIWCVNGRKQDSLVLFDLSDEFQVGVLCDQKSEPFYNKIRYEDDDPYYERDPFVTVLHNAMYRRLINPYKIDYKKEEEYLLKCQRETSEALDRMFNSTTG